MSNCRHRCCCCPYILQIIVKIGLYFRIQQKSRTKSHFNDFLVNLILRFIHGSKKFDYYRFYLWGSIDIFLYFSHNYVTILPISWINTGHRNGIPILGTIIIEFDAAKHILDGLLRTKHDTNRYIEALVL